MNTLVRNNLTPAGDSISGEFLKLEWLTEEPPEQEFCVNPIAPVGAVTLIVGKGGTGKTLLSLKMAVHIALGLDIIGASASACNVAYMSLEDPETVLRSRLHKIAHDEDILPYIDDLTKRIFLIDRHGMQTHMAVYDNGNVVIAKITDALVDLLKENEIKCIFIDTLIRTNSLNENDNAQMGALLVAFEKIASEVRCAVILIHHLPKDSVSKSHAARGASAITDNARSALLLEKVAAKEANIFRDEEIKTAILDGRLVKVMHTKHNYSAGHPVQYMELTKNGAIIERFPSTDMRAISEQRYIELYAWWITKWGSKPLTKTNIDDSTAADIRPDKTKHGKSTYRAALDWAIQHGHASQIAAPEYGSKNSLSKYYRLTKIEQ